MLFDSLMQRLNTHQILSTESLTRLVLCLFNSQTWSCEITSSPFIVIRIFMFIFKCVINKFSFVKVSCLYYWHRRYILGMCQFPIRKILDKRFGINEKSWFWFQGVSCWCKMAVSYGRKVKFKFDKTFNVINSYLKGLLLFDLKKF